MRSQTLGVLRYREQAMVLAGLAVIAAAGWIYLVWGAGIETMAMRAMRMGASPDMAPGMAMATEWTPAYVGEVLVMWVVMIMAMMLPGVAFAAIRVSNGADGSRHVWTAAWFVVGYLIVWTAFSLAATLLQWMLQSRDVFSGLMGIQNPLAASLLIAVIGFYQLTPLKQAALRYCRAPTECAAFERAPVVTIIGKGFRHGIACVGCTAPLMGLLFAVGLMNLIWMAVITLWIVLEKALPWGRSIAYFAGAALIAWGGLALFSAA